MGFNHNCYYVLFTYYFIPKLFMKKRIYLAGCGGMLGEAFYDIFKEDFILKCTDKDVNEDWLSFLDFRNYLDYKNDVIDFKPNYLFHLGALTDLEYCETNKDDAYITNTLSVEYAVKISNQLCIPLLYISTAGIFDGKKELYDDWDIPNPLGVYARSKFLGEKFVIQNANKFLICRAGWMMGGGVKKDKKFINKIINQIKNGSKKLNIVNDKDGTPTYTIDFAKNVKYLIENKHWGLFNMVCGGQTSRIEVTEEILKILNKTNSIKINAVESDYFSSTYFASRPPNERLLNYRLDLLKSNLMRNWKISLNDYLTTSYNTFIDKVK